MAHPKKARRHANPDFRHRVPVPLPPVAEIDQQLWELLSPSLLAPRRLERADPRPPQRTIRLRARLLTLPVMVAILLSLVWRRLAAVAEVCRVVAREGVLWVAPLHVSEQALTKRLETLPAAVLGELFAEVCTRLQAQPPPTWPGLEAWAAVRSRFPVIALADGTTLEALRKKTPALQGRAGLVLAGRLMMLVEAFSHRPLWQFYTEDAAANDKRFTPEILAAVPQGGLLVFDLGFFSFLWFDEVTQAGRYFVTRLRQKTTSRTQQVLSQGPHYREELVQLGATRTPPCRHPLRLVSGLWGGQWQQYLTNVLDPRHLSARQVCELYQRRWRIEDAFLLTKRVLDLAYLWTASPTGVQLQILATLIFYAVLMHLCQQVAQALQEPLERISVEMVFRALYHYSRAVQRGESDDLVAFLVTHAVLLGLIKRQRKRHRERQQMEQSVWDAS